MQLQMGPITARLLLRPWQKKPPKNKAADLKYKVGNAPELTPGSDPTSPPPGQKTKGKATAPRKKGLDPANDEDSSLLPGKKPMTETARRKSVNAAAKESAMRSTGRAASRPASASHLTIRVLFSTRCPRAKTVLAHRRLTQGITICIQE